jgi:hypothetical protein
MSSAANSQSNGAPWGRGPRWGEQPWHPAWGPPWAWGWRGFPRPMAIVFTILGFMLWWPVGLAILFYMLGSGVMGCGSFRRRGNDAGAPWRNSPAGNAAPPWANWRSWCGGERQTPGSGNRAFDEYRAETLRRLEEEQQEFAAFLERLRFAKDKAEFDQFMNERRRPAAPPDAAEPSAA